MERGKMEKNCLFCQIIHREVPGEFIHDGESVVAFKDKYPNAPVHILVVPKKHIRSTNDLKNGDRNIVSDMIFLAKEIAKNQGIDRSGYRLIINTERGGGQYVFHIHLHLMGGW